MYCVLNQRRVGRLVGLQEINNYSIVALSKLIFVSYGSNL